MIYNTIKKNLHVQWVPPHFSFHGTFQILILQKTGSIIYQFICQQNVHCICADETHNRKDQYNIGRKCACIGY